MSERPASDELDPTCDVTVDAASDLMDRVAEEFAGRCRRGESPTVAEYARRYPQYAGQIRKLLPSVALMERLKGHVRASAEPIGGGEEATPERLGEYRIVRELGRGGMGIVYEAFQESLGRHVALKVIPRHGLLDAKRRQRFQREAMAVAQLHHTNIVPIFAAGEHDGLPYYAMQYIRGNGLDRLLETWRREGPARDGGHWRSVARVGIQAAEALQYAHNQGILHRDVKPANVLVDEHQVAWITDFGLAKLVGRDELTNSGDVVGTLRYLAPEALRGQFDHRGDIYSLGLTLYEVLTLQLPFGDLSPSELLRCVTDAQPIRPRKVDRSIPLDLETVVLKATAREPGDRYATAGALADDLRAFLDDRPIRARRASPPERLARWCRRNRVLAAVSAVAVMSLLVALGAVSWSLVTTHRALQKANADVDLSLRYFGELFNALTDPADAGPFADGADAPPFGPFGPLRGELLGPRAGGADGGLPPMGGRRPSVGREGPPPPDESRPPGDGPGRRRLSWLGERELAVLGSVLEFYNDFAERNRTNVHVRLQDEAARASRKVAALYRLFGQPDKAEEAQARALAHFEAQVARHGENEEYGYELARTLALDGPGADTVPVARAEPDLRRAIGIVERLAQRKPLRNQKAFLAALARWRWRLGTILEQQQQTDEAIASYRASIDEDERLARLVDEPSIVREALARRRTELARMLITVGRGDDARPLVDQAAADLRAVAADARFPGERNEMVAACLQQLAGACRELGDTAQADRLGELAQRIRGRRPGRGGGDRFGHPGDGPRGPRPRS